MFDDIPELYRGRLRIVRKRVGATPGETGTLAGHPSF
jgi:hypothetical protein